MTPPPPRSHIPISTMKKMIIYLLWISTFLMIVMVLASWIVLILTVEMLFIFATVPHPHIHDEEDDH